MDTQRRQLIDFLKGCRARLSPAQVGLPDTNRRRTPGLRREDVAALAGVSVTWYTWLEQGRQHPSIGGRLGAGSARLCACPPTSASICSR